MKKAVAAFAAVLALGAGADALVYNFTANLKTTVAQKGSVKAAILTCLDESETMVYRKQGTVKIQGLIWGCDCDPIANPPPFTNGESDGFAFWNVTDKSIITDIDFQWLVLNRINNTGKNVEGAWSFASECYQFWGGGFGTVKLDGEEFYLDKMSGNMAGVKCAPVYFKKGWKKNDCPFCGEGIGEDDEYIVAIGWPLCECGEEDELTAVSGTWNIKINAPATKKLNKTTSIFNAFTFPSYVKNYLLENEQ